MTEFLGFRNIWVAEGAFKVSGDPCKMLNRTCLNLRKKITKWYSLYWCTNVSDYERKNFKELNSYRDRSNLERSYPSILISLFKTSLSSLVSLSPITVAFIIRKGVSTPLPHFKIIPPFLKILHPPTLPANRSSQVFLINRMQLWN